MRRAVVSALLSVAVCASLRSGAFVAGEVFCTDGDCRTNRDCNATRDAESCRCASQPFGASGMASWRCQKTYAACETRCASDADCIVREHTADSCPTCYLGMCTQPTCSTNGVFACSGNLDCGPLSGTCGCSIRRTNGPTLCTKLQAGYCGTTCRNDADCPTRASGAECTTCNYGSCAMPQCGSNCTVDGDCVQALGCHTCVAGTCAKKPGTCGTACTHDRDCNATGTECTMCYSQAPGDAPAVCVPENGCGLSCLSMLDCSYNANCNYCGDGGSCTTYAAGKTAGPAPGTPEYHALVEMQREMIRAGKLHRLRH
uniref:Uncharacterized protein n=1 Tax=Neobodo designis TaxID=312471 RepID=A0A7S1KY68_NEODS